MKVVERERSWSVYRLYSVLRQGPSTWSGGRARPTGEGANVPRWARAPGGVRGPSTCSGGRAGERPDGAGGRGGDVPRRARAPAGVSGFRAPAGVHARRSASKVVSQLQTTSKKRTVAGGASGPTVRFYNIYVCGRSSVCREWE